MEGKATQDSREFEEHLQMLEKKTRETGREVYTVTRSAEIVIDF